MIRVTTFAFVCPSVSPTTLVAFAAPCVKACV